MEKIKKAKKARYETNDEFVGFRLTTSQKKFLEDVSLKQDISMGRWIRRQIFKGDI